MSEDNRQLLSPQNHYGTICNDAEEVIIPVKRRKPLLYAVLSLLAFIVIIGGINIYFVSQRSQELIQKSMELNIQSVELSKVDTHGLQFEMNAMSLVDYDEIDESYYKNLFKLGGSLFQEVTIQSDQMEISTVIEDKKVVLGIVKTKPMVVDIQNHHSTALNVLIDIQPRLKNMMGLVKKIMSDPGESLKLIGNGLIALKIGYISLGSFPISFEEWVMPKEYLNIDTDSISIDQLTFEKSNEVYDISGSLSLLNPIYHRSLGFDVPPVQLGLYSIDCHDEIIPLLPEITVDESALSSMDEYLHLNFSTRIEGIDPLLKECNGSTILNTLIHDMMNNETIQIILRDFQIPSMGSLNKLTSLIDFRAGYKYPQSPMDQFVRNITMNDIKFRLEDLNVYIDGKVDIFINIPQTLDPKVIKVRGVPKLYHQGEQFAVIDLAQWHDCSNEMLIEDQGQVLYVSVPLHHEALEITDASAFNSFVNELLIEGGAVLDIDMSMDLLIDMIQQFEVDDIKVKTSTRIIQNFL
jgi:hypothetical protein